MMLNTDFFENLKKSSCDDLDTGLGLDLSGNTVQVSSSLTGQSSASILVLFDNLQSLQSLKGLASQSSGASDPMRRLASVALTDSVNLSDGGNSDWGPDVDVTSD